MIGTKLTCPKCGGPMRFMVDTTIVADGELFHNLTKKAYRGKGVQLHGVHWETADKICEAQDCGHIIFSPRRSDRAELRARIAELESLVKEAPHYFHPGYDFDGKKLEWLKKAGLV